MSRRSAWLLLLSITACAVSDDAVVKGSHIPLLVVPMREAFVVGSVQPVPGFAERLERLGRESAGRSLRVVVGAFNPVTGADPSWSSRRLPHERARVVAARLRAAGCAIVGVTLVADDPGRDGVIEVFAAAAR